MFHFRDISKKKNQFLVIEVEESDPLYESSESMRWIEYKLLFRRY